MGPPNAGKSTLFNRLTGLRQKVANYPGVTVERKSGVHGTRYGPVDVVDLPGIHGLSPRSLDQIVTRDVLLGKIADEPAPDAVILVLDATRLESHLMVAEPVLALGLPVLVVLTMADELDRRAGKITEEGLSDHLGVEVCLINARAGRGLDKVERFLEALYTGGEEVRACPAVAGADAETASEGRPLPVVDVYAARRARAKALGAAARFQAPGPSALTERLDGIFLHRFLGPAIFIAVVIFVFQAIFTWATPLMDGTEALIASSGEWLAPKLPEGWIRSLLIDGVWLGVGSVVVFLPQILILFFFIGILEDSGYMARGAVIADRMMNRVGLQGQSFLPLLSAYACAVPAILAARTVEDERDRLATIFVAPFMTCSARLPVYALLIAAFIPQRQLLGPFLSQQSAVLFGLYALGFLAAVGTAALLKRSLLKGRPSPFVMELPPYRLPTLKSIVARLWDRTRIFLRRAGRIILTVAVGIWLLAQLPPTAGEGPPPVEESVLGSLGKVIEPVIEPLGFDWRIGIGLVTSLAAREVIVGTLGTIYGVEDEDETSLELQDALRQDLDLGSAVALMVFFVFALQCMSTVAVMRRETGGWRWPALQFGYMLTLAYVLAWGANALL